MGRFDDTNGKGKKNVFKDTKDSLSYLRKQSRFYVSPTDRDKFLKQGIEYLNKGIELKECGSLELARKTFLLAEENFIMDEKLFKNNPALSPLFYKLYFHMEFYDCCKDIKYNSQENRHFTSNIQAYEISGQISPRTMNVEACSRQVEYLQKYFSNHWYTNLKKGDKYHLTSEYSKAMIEYLIAEKKFVEKKNCPSDLIAFKILECKFQLFLTDPKSYEGYFEEAWNGFLELSEKGYKNPELSNTIGIINYMGKKYDDAIALFLETTNLAPNHIDAWISLCDIYSELGNDFERTRCLENVKAIDPNNPFLQEAN